MPEPTLLLAWACLALALVPALTFALNMVRYRRTAPPATRPAPVSILIPARDEERSIAASVQAARASVGVDVEVVVLDDGSTDRTAQIVQDIAAMDPRVGLEQAPPLPPGWNGKQHACQVLAGLARHDLLLFVDADVRLAPDAALRMVSFADSARADLVSGVPRQETGPGLERLLIPLIHFFLLAFLPMGAMRRSTQPSYGAGCGQLFLARREAYDRAGGHRSLRSSRHDGLKLPRAFRQAGLRTDLFDATDLAVCRMYRSTGEVRGGLAKNATEGLAAPRLLLPTTGLLLMGQVLPFVLVALPGVPPGARLVAGAAALVAWLPRFAAAARYRQSWTGASLHPLGVALLLVVQWQAAARSLAGRPASWKGRSYPMAEA